MLCNVLFICCEGTLIKEPPDNFQADTLEQLEFLPGVFRSLYFMRNKLDFEFVMVANQRRLVTPDSPQENVDRHH